MGLSGCATAAHNTTRPKSVHNGAVHSYTTGRGGGAKKKKVGLVNEKKKKARPPRGFPGIMYKGRVGKQTFSTVWRCGSVSY